MRGFAKITAAGVVAVATALAPTGRAAGQPEDLAQVPVEDSAYSAQRPIAPAPWDRAVRFALSMGSTMINTVVFPVKLAIGVAGAEVGGLAGAMNGGDVEAAAGIWNVTTDGSYFETPQVLDGRDTFRYGSDEN